MKKTIFLNVLLCLFSAVWLKVLAYDCKIDGIYYNLDKASQTASVTYHGFDGNFISHYYSGEISIPETITYKNVTYDITSIGDSAFYWCGNLTYVDIPYSVTSIGDYAFSGCAISSINIPYYVTSIGDHAFSECYALTSVNIPDGVASISDYAFYKCRLASLNIPYSVTSIGDYAFACCAISSIDIPNSVTRIGDYAFWDNAPLTSVNLPDCITSIGCGVFYQCNQLASPVYNSTCFVYMPRLYYNAYTIPDGITSICGGAFMGCVYLSDILIPNSVTSIGDYAFSGCSLLTSIEIPSSVTSIGEKAFADSGLLSIDIPNSVTSIGYGIIKGCKGMSSPVYNSTCFVYMPPSYSGAYTIPEGIACICGGAFIGCVNLTDILISNSVTSIGEQAFDGCSSLTSVSIPDGVTTIDFGTFAGCIGLKSVSIPNSVNTIGDEAFGLCSGLTSVTIPDGVTSIGRCAFGDCSGLTSVDIPNSVTSIGLGAFQYCSSLTSVTIPNIVTSIGDYAFEGCNKLVSPVCNSTCFVYMPPSYSGAYTIPEGITRICGGAFGVCSRLTSVTIPNSVTSIGDEAFCGCGLTSIDIPNSVTTIGGGAFYSCSRLTSVTIGESVTSIGCDAFYNCRKLTSITIPKSVNFIANGIFSGCSSLTAITVAKDNPIYDSRNNCNAIIETATNTLIAGCKNAFIPQSVTSIGQEAFAGVEWKPIVIPHNVSRIDKFAFNIGGEVTDVYCYADSVPQAAESSFGQDLSIFYSDAVSFTLYVPAESVELYKSIFPWNKFGKIVALSKGIEIVPMEEDTEIAIDKIIVDETDLTDAVIDNVYVTLNTDNADGYDKDEMCIVLASTVTDEQLAAIAEKIVGEKEVKENFSGFIMEVPAGEGVVSITMQTVGNRVLNVKVGNDEPCSFTQTKRGTIEVPYKVNDTSYIYIYGSDVTPSDGRRRVQSRDVKHGVMIYSLKWTSQDASSISSYQQDDETLDIYTLDGRKLDGEPTVPGVYIVNGKKMYVK